MADVRPGDHDCEDDEPDAYQARDETAGRWAHDHMLPACKVYIKPYGARLAEDSAAERRAASRSQLRPPVSVMRGLLERVRQLEHGQVTTIAPNDLQADG